jgi:hypothetical protein
MEIGVELFSSPRRAEMVTPRLRAIIPRVETGGDFSDFSTFDR